MTIRKKVCRFITTHKKPITITCVVLALIVLVNIIIITYVKSENAIYYWDISAYWTSAINLLRTAQDSIINGWYLIRDSITQADYSLIPIVPFLPFLKIFGTSRLVFVLLTLNIYVIPFVLIITYLTYRVFSFSKKPLLTALLSMSTILLMPPLLIPVIDGRIDAVGLLIIAIIALTLYKANFTRKTTPYSILIGLLLCLLVISRRWYLYWIVSFFVAFIATKFIFTLRRHKNHFSKRLFSDILPLTKNLFVSGMTFLITLAVLFLPTFKRLFFVNYSDIYSAYMIGDQFNQISLFIRHFGLILIIPTIVGVILSFTKRYRKSILPKLSIFLIIQSVLIFTLFTHTQSFNVHHYYLLLPIFIFSFTILIDFLLSSKHQFSAYIPSLVTLALSIYTFTGERLPAANIPQQIALGLSSSTKPIVRHDTKTIRSLVNYMQDTMSPSEYVYILSSSDYFNDSIFTNALLPDQPTINISTTNHVDKRDGFPNHLFMADYVIVANPTQTHLGPENQLVISLIGQSIIDGLCPNLQLINSFVIDNNIHIAIYHKTAPYSQEYLNYLYRAFSEAYPDYPNLNDPALFVP